MLSPYVVDAGEALDKVVSSMAKQEIGSAVVTQEGKLAGILTTTDVCRVLGEVLREHYPAG